MNRSDRGFHPGSRTLHSYNITQHDSDGEMAREWAGERKHPRVSAHIQPLVVGYSSVQEGWSVDIFQEQGLGSSSSLQGRSMAQGTWLSENCNMHPVE